MAQHKYRARAVKIKRLSGTVAEKAFKALELPPDMLAGMCHFELSGNREVVVDGCQGILEYDENIIRLKTNKMNVRFLGRGLSLRNLKKDSTIIEGFITSIEFES